MPDVTKIIEAVAEGKASATEELLPVIYDNLRNIARSRLARESSDHTLQPTALVHEVYMKLIGDRADTWKNRSHFYAAASEAMRRILVDHGPTHYWWTVVKLFTAVYMMEIRDVRTSYLFIGIQA